MLNAVEQIQTKIRQHCHSHDVQKKSFLFLYRKKSDSKLTEVKIDRALPAIITQTTGRLYKTCVDFTAVSDMNIRYLVITYPGAAV